MKENYKLKTKLQEDLKGAMKEGCKDVIQALRDVLSKVEVEEKKGSQKELSDKEILKLIAKTVKELKEEESFIKTDRDKINSLNYQYRYLEVEYLPRLYSIGELKRIVELRFDSEKNFGQNMKFILSFPDAHLIDKKMLSELIKEKY